MKNRVQKLWQFVQPVVTHPVFIAAVVIIAAGAALVTMLTPKIDRVLVVDDNQLIIEGRRFGPGPGELTVEVGEALTLRETAEWSGAHIVVTDPAVVDSSGGWVTVRRLGLFTSNRVPFVVQDPDLPSEPYGYEVPVQPESPWPTFRRDHRNTGSSPITAVYSGDEPWFFQTGKGIFSTPVIDSEGNIYIGSADRIFYALAPDGSERWRFETGEIIDSAAALPRTDSAPTVIVPSGDGYIYHLNAEDGSLIWQFDARVAPRASYNDWWEGNIALGYDGTIYAGNTNFNYYAISPEGELECTYESGSNNWALAGLGVDGTIYWASNDTFIRAVAPDGSERWRKRTLGFLAASAAVGSDGTIYIGSFDSVFYALDPLTGAVRWTFKTDDHIYSYAALAEDDNGETTAIYVASTDGRLYALDTSGTLLWTFDTGDPIRSSPVIGQAPEGGQIVYFGSGNGTLYALNAEDGTRRWSFDTTAADDPVLRDRNDLNASPALGETGIVIAGEHGQIWYVPYDYCLQADDIRCETSPVEDLPADVAGVFYVTPGGSTILGDPPELSPATVITLRLLVREAGETIDAWVCNSPLGCPDDALTITIDPQIPFEVEQSADGHFVHIIPQGYLTPGQTYTISVSGDYYTRGTNIGNLTLGGRPAGEFDDSVTLTTAQAIAEELPLELGSEEVSAFEWTRLAVPVPPMMPSLNQIGFDYIDWIVGTVAKEDGKLIMWATGAERDANGILRADPDTDFTLALSGTYEGDSFILTNRDFVMPVTGIPIPFNTFEIRGQLDDDLRVQPGSTAWADTEVLSIPTFGPYLVVAGLANNGWEKLLVMATYITRPYEGPANQQPEGLTVTDLSFTPPTGSEDGYAEVVFASERPFSASDRRPALLLIDAAETQAVYIDYHNNLTTLTNPDGDITGVRLTIPAGTQLPSDLEIIVILDVYPVARITPN
ncbi:MAG: PQQ-binding-like beta-propeller repeat protein [Anaerolineae bacterium]